MFGIPFMKFQKQHWVWAACIVLAASIFFSALVIAASWEQRDVVRQVPVTVEVPLPVEATPYPFTQYLKCNPIWDYQMTASAEVQRYIYAVWGPGTQYETLCEGDGFHANTRYEFQLIELSGDVVFIKCNIYENDNVVCGNPEPKTISLATPQSYPQVEAYINLVEDNPAYVILVQGFTQDDTAQLFYQLNQLEDGRLLLVQCRLFADVGVPSLCFENNSPPVVTETP